MTALEYQRKLFACIMSLQMSKSFGKVTKVNGVYACTIHEIIPCDSWKWIMQNANFYRINENGITLY